MSVEKITDDSFEKLLESNEKVIVKYFADWCGSCKLFSPKYRRLSEDEQFNGIVFLDINAEENDIARKKAGVDNLPYFAVFKGGEKLDGMSTSKEEKVVELLSKLQS